MRSCTPSVAIRTASLPLTATVITAPTDFSTARANCRLTGLSSTSRTRAPRAPLTSADAWGAAETVAPSRLANGTSTSNQNFDPRPGWLAT